MTTTLKHKLPKNLYSVIITCKVFIIGCDWHISMFGIDTVLPDQLFIRNLLPKQGWNLTAFPKKVKRLGAMISKQPLFLEVEIILHSIPKIFWVKHLHNIAHGLGNVSLLYCG